MNKKTLFALLFITHSILLIASDGLSVSGIKKLNEKIKEYKYVGHFHEGLAAVVKDRKIGFIDKSGDLVIPMKWDATNQRAFRLDEEVMFNNGRCYIPPTENSNAYIIDKNGNELYSGKRITINKTRDFDVMYVDNDSGHSTYFVKKDNVKKMESYENEYPVIVTNWNYNNPEDCEQIYFSLEKLCDGNLVGKETLETKYGYTVSPSLNCSFDGVGLITLYDNKTNKYGIVDEKGNVVVPFQYDNKICLCYGLLIENIYVVEQTFMEKMEVCCNIYKDGSLLYKHIPTTNELYASMGMFCFKAADGAGDRKWWSDMLGCDESKIPEINSETKWLDMNGKEVSRFQLGKNYLRPDDDGYWQLEDEGGDLVYPNRFKPFHRFQNMVEIGFPDTYGEGLLLTDTGDTIPSQYADYLKAGIVKMTNLPNVELLCNYKKELSDKDNYRNCHFYLKKSYQKLNVVRWDGAELLPFNVDEVGYFSEGLLRIKLGNRYFFIDEEGNGIIKD